TKCFGGEPASACASVDVDVGGGGGVGEADAVSAGGLGDGATDTGSCGAAAAAADTRFVRATTTAIPASITTERTAARMGRTYVCLCGGLAAANCIAEGPTDAGGVPVVVLGESAGNAGNELTVCPVTGPAGIDGGAAAPRDIR